MKVIAINGSLRKNWNTGTLLKNALDGAVCTEAKGEFIRACVKETRGFTMT